MQRIQERLKRAISETLTPLLPPGSKKVGIIDPPSYSNIGDHAIFLGQLSFLESCLDNPEIVIADFRTYPEEYQRILGECSVLLLQGGGNFGDHWSHHHNFRLEIIRAFPHVPIIQLPQSVFFKQKENLDRTRELINSHQNFTLIIRDNRSFGFCKENFNCPVFLCPDMAFAIEGIPATGSYLDVSCLMRDDKELLVEKRDDIRRVLSARDLSYQVNDWLDERNIVASKLNGLASRIVKRVPVGYGLSVPFLTVCRRYYARQRFLYGAKLLGRGKKVVTDRLHGHIMSILLGRENFTFDSLDGKISAFHETWTWADPRSHMISSITELEESL